MASPVPSQQKRQPKQRLWIWFAALALFYSVWLYLVINQGYWQQTTENWPMAVAMLFGSYAAGSTPMGGGSVGFPILVLLFEQSASLGRDFSFAIQSVGMTSASIFILASRQPLAWAMLKGAMLGALVGTPLGIWFIAPFVPELWIKMIFAVIWASFGLLHLYRLQEITAHSGMTEISERWDFRLGLWLGLSAGATVAATTGVGIDMVIYCALVLLCRADMKIAIPTSVLIMAFTSVLGVGVKLLGTGLTPGVFEKWLAAAPVVALGAPLGAYVVAKIGRKPTLLVVAALCVLQYFWTVYATREQLGLGGVLLSVAAVAACLLALEKLRQLGARLVGYKTAKEEAGSEE
ncbi:sulfite exporter TauE/SafE family protein [Aliiglaciecola sp. CAU 1673]|uniref:sulfite exporter TauE/SafE family protein n=1 Tax=Aliiglaciecola sp. CAU 1673 TaxID=3032595 RepID=UPI0023DA96DB|nr:sulfite exporter TauE/SafE family protein [Aliiglaciecola sp. CAU 1673]MDF2179821.1 sulfite exporter TauE/SafE family protein [Aliiglaciecola sp. CAU 1673]